MDKFDRIFRLHAILASRRTPISLDELKRKLDCSKATVHRTINALKDYLAAPIVFDSERQGYRYTADAKAPELNCRGCGSHPQSCRRSRLCSDFCKRPAAVSS